VKHEIRGLEPFHEKEDPREQFLPAGRDSMTELDNVPLGPISSSPAALPEKEEYHLFTVPLVAIDRPPPAHPEKERYHLPVSVRQAIIAGLARALDPQPERTYTQGVQAGKQGTSTLGSLPVLSLTTALGLLIASIADYLSRYGNNVFEIVLLSGLLLIFVPNMVRLLSPMPSRFERICLLCLFGVSCYLIFWMQSPFRFSGYDEFLQWRTATNIAMSGHLFDPNSLLPVSPYYPGLEMVAEGLSSITGLSIFQAGIAIICAARILMVLALFMFYEQITRSSRMASIATMIYMLNPHFLIFDAIFSYESLALPLAACMLYILARFETADKGYRWVTFTAYVVLMAVTITHHMTDYFFVGFLILWAAVTLFQASSYWMRRNLIVITLFGVLLALAYTFLLKGNPVRDYLSQYFGATFNELEHIITGTSTPRELFASGTSHAPIWDELLMLSSVVFVSFGLPFGLLILWQHYRRNALAVTLGIASLLYPLSQAFRFTNFGAEITDRAAAFLFLPVAFLLTLFIAHFWPTRMRSWRATSLVTCALAAVFLGGVIIESGPSWSSFAGPYLVGADTRSITPEGIQTASWALSYLGPDNQVGADRINQFLMLAYGDQRIVASTNTGVDISSVFFSPRFGPQEAATLQQAHIRYLVVDLRLSTSVPLYGFYFDDGEPGAFAYVRPISRADLTKFNAVPQLNRIYDSGDIVIYEVRALR